MLESFLIKLEDCIFLQNEEVVQQADARSMPAMPEKEKQPAGDRIKYVWIRIEKEINGQKYTFLSPPFVQSLESLKIRIEFYGKSFVHYEHDNPRDYYFTIE
jgi:hypothetical protein